MDFNTLIQTFLSLAGVGAFVSALTNLFKVLGWVQDGDAQNVVTGLDLLFVIALFVANLLGFHNFADIDQTISTLAKILTLVIQLFSAKVGSVAFHFAFRGVPFIGASYSQKTIFGIGGPTK